MVFAHATAHSPRQHKSIASEMLTSIRFGMSSTIPVERNLQTQKRPPAQRAGGLLVRLTATAANAAFRGRSNAQFAEAAGAASDDAGASVGISPLAAVAEVGSVAGLSPPPQATVAMAAAIVRVRKMAMLFIFVCLLMGGAERAGE